MLDAVPKERTPLTFTFTNIGPIKDAELELGDLTIIAGRNKGPRKNNFLEIPVVSQ